MGKRRLDIWSQEGTVDRYLMKRLTAMARSGDWWAGCINIMVGMVIQLLARDSMSHTEIAEYVGCSESCVKLIAKHYKSTVNAIGAQYRELHIGDGRSIRL